MIFLQIITRLYIVPIKDQILILIDNAVEIL